MEGRLLGAEAGDAGDLKGRIWGETKQIWRVAFPAMLARVSQFGMFVVTQAFIGQFGQVQLAAYALIQIITVRFANGILLGMASATETLCGQAFGAKQYHMMGIYLQRSWIINLVTATILLPVFIFAGPIFELLGQEETVADVAGFISLLFIPILYFFVLGFTLQNYLQAQLKNMIVGWVAAVSFLLHLLLSWIFVSRLDWGIPGAMGALIIANWVVVIGEFVYVLGGWCPNTWTGFTLAAFTDLIPTIKLSISSGVMLCLEMWYNAVLVLLAGYTENATVQISAFSICLNITAWQFMLCIGILAASSVRVSIELGRGNAKAAKFAFKVLFVISLIVGIFFSTLCLIFDREIAQVFTSDEEVIEEVANLSVLLSLSVLLNGIQCALSGVAVGAGRQNMVAYVNITCYYVVGVPLGVVLGFVVQMQVKGIWTGMIIGVVLQVLVLGYITYRTDWNEQVRTASERVTTWLLKPSQESNAASTPERLNEGPEQH